MNKAPNQDPRAPQVLTTFRHPMEAAQLVNLLIERGIEARTSGTTIASGSIEFAQIDVEVLVPNEQLESARTITEDFRSNEAVIDWSKVDWRNDEAGEQFETTDASASDSIESSISRLLYPNPKPRVNNWLVANLVIGLLITAIMWFSFN